VVGLLHGDGPAGVGQVGEALVGERGVEEVAVGGDVAGGRVGEEDCRLREPTLTVSMDT
jgi:hypothetical protein